MKAIDERRERVFLLLAGFFLASMTLLNVLGVSRFIDLSFSLGSWEIPFKLTIGVLPYPLTFLCTDLVSELYGRKRANYLVCIGLLANLWVFFILWIGGLLPPVPPLDAAGLPPVDDYQFAFYRIRVWTLGTVTASMVAYLLAQFLDVWLFHFWKRVTQGKHLWLRNNGSTLVSQFVDSFTVLTLAHFLTDGIVDAAGGSPWPQLWVLILSGYVFKMAAAVIDTVPFYWLVHFLRRFLELPTGTHGEDELAQSL